MKIEASAGSFGRGFAIIYIKALCAVCLFCLCRFSEAALSFRFSPEFSYIRSM